MKKWMFLVAAVLLSVSVFCACNKDNGEEERISIASSPCAVMEYAEESEEGYKLVTSEIASLYTFDSLRLKESADVYEGDWIYRITFNPEEYVKNSAEIVVEFKEHSVSVNGKEYVPENGVDYADILDWAKNKYEYFDYELIKVS